MNLYSKWRGINRFPALTMTLDLLAERPEIGREVVSVAPAAGHAALDRPGDKAGATRPQGRGREDRRYRAGPGLPVERGGQPHDRRGGARTCRRSPSCGSRSKAWTGQADVLVVSATPGEALQREWEEHGLSRHVALIAGQELGSKKEHLGARDRRPLRQDEGSDGRRRPGRPCRGRGQRRALLSDRSRPARTSPGSGSTKRPCPASSPAPMRALT